MELYADHYLKKYASTNNLSDKDKQAEMERELIKKVQLGDNMAMNKLTRLYRGLLHECVRSSGITTIMEPDTAHQYALKSLKKTVKNNFNVNNAMARPATYITSSVVGDLKKVMADNMNIGVVSSQDLQRKAKTKAIADKHLAQQLGRTPTYQETLDFIHKEMNMGSDITVDNLKRIDMYKTKEYSSNEIVGGKDKPEGAQQLSFADIKNTPKKTGSDILQNQREEQKLLNHLNSYTNDQGIKRLVQNMYGFGEFKGNRAKSVNVAAVNSNMTYYEATKALTDYKNDLRKKGIL